MLFISVPGLMTRQRILVLLLLIVLCLSACVTQTERVAYNPYAQPEDESVWDELRHEFGWQKPPRNNPSGEPFYQRAAHGVSKTVTGWFHKKDVTPVDAQKQAEDAGKLEESRQEFEQKRQEAFRQLREQQGLSETMPECLYLPRSVLVAHYSVLLSLLFAQAAERFFPFLLELAARLL